MAPRHDPAPHRRWRRPRCSFLLPDGDFIPWHGKPHHEFIERWRQLVREWDERRETWRAAGEADPVCCPRCDGTLTLCERPADFDASLMTDRWRCENRACAIDEVRAGSARQWWSEHARAHHPMRGPTTSCTHAPPAPQARVRKSGGVARVEVTRGAVTERDWELRKREAWLGSLRPPPKPRRELAAELEPTPPPTEHPLPALYRDWLEKHPRGGTAPRRD